MSFTPSNLIDPTKEKDWPASLGMLDWDSTNIIFTKRSLLEFLKYTGTTVDTNFFNVQKLPKYAVFGKFDPTLPKPGEKPVAVTSAAAAAPSQSATAAVANTAAAAEVPPDQPAEEEEEQGIQFSSAPRPSRRVREAPGGKDSLSSLWGEETTSIDEFRPTRRVREGPGGQDSISQIF